MNGGVEPRPERYGDPVRAAGDGFESGPQRVRRVLRTRPAESALHRVLAGSANLFRGDDYPQQLAEAAAGTQLAVTTGRRIAVVGSRGGAGKTTVAALLARIYAAMRADAVAAIDLAPSAGTLGLRLGVPDAPPLEAAAARLGTGTPDTLRGLAALLTVAEPANLLVTGRRRTADPRPIPGPRPAAAAVWMPTGPQEPPVWTPAGTAAGLGAGEGFGATGSPGAVDGLGAVGSPGAMDGLGAVGNPGAVGSLGAGSPQAADGAARLSRVVSRYCPITVFDCGPGLTDPAALWAVGHSHLALFVTPASVAGLEDAVEYAGYWRHQPALASVPLLVLVVQSSADRVFSAGREAGRLRQAGIDALHLGRDRHLAAGVEVLPALLSRRTRLEAVSIASRVLAAAAFGSGTGLGSGSARPGSVRSGSGRSAEHAAGRNAGA